MSYRSASARAAAFDQALAEAMSATVPDAIDTQDTAGSDPAAGTPGPEGEPSDAVAAVAAIGDTSPEPDDRDGVKRHFQKLREQGEKHYLPQKEFERQARLRRWQAVDPRERRQ